MPHDPPPRRSGKETEMSYYDFKGQAAAQRAYDNVSDTRKQALIAADFGIAQTTVSAIKTGKTWRIAP